MRKYKEAGQDAEKPEERSELPFALTVPEVAKLLNINLTAAYGLTRRDGFPRLIIGKRITIPSKQFLEFVARESCGEKAEAPGGQARSFNAR